MIRPSRSTAETQPQLQPALLRLSAIISQYFTGIGTSTLPLPSALDTAEQRQHLVELSSVDDEGLGEELSVVWELEPGVTCFHKAQLPALREFDAPRVFDAFLDAVALGVGLNRLRDVEDRITAPYFC
jgi:hypothetical protein